MSQVRTWLGTGQAGVTEIIKLELLPASRTEAEFERLSATLDALHPLMTDEVIWNATARNGFTLRRR